ncbi:hypothetical protein [Facilibium subflavum]|uniref:hypothetical protein n=1 Tax=Facilibium subflavum TaxID=2219058 RepID=UPI0013C2A86B|nr:hypothetical protein [Facilibium subflavum]
MNKNRKIIKKVLHYTFTKLTISGAGQTVIKGDITFINHEGKTKQAIFYFYIEGKPGRYIITKIIAFDANNHNLREENI